MIQFPSGGWSVFVSAFSRFFRILIAPAMALGMGTPISPAFSVIESSSFAQKAMLVNASIGIRLGASFQLGGGSKGQKSKTKTYLFFRYRRNKAFYCTSQLRMPNDKMDRRGISLGDHCPAPLMDQDL